MPDIHPKVLEQLVESMPTARMDWTHIFWNIIEFVPYSKKKNAEYNLWNYISQYILEGFCSILSMLDGVSNFTKRGQRTAGSVVTLDASRCEWPTTPASYSLQLLIRQ